MDSKDRNVIIYNYNFKEEEKVKYLKFKELFSSDDSVSSDNSLEDKTFVDTHKNKNWCTLPTSPCFEKVLNFPLWFQPGPKTTPSEPTKMQYDNIKATREEDKKLLKPEPKKAKILPRVIWHTSCPYNTLAYYYHYSNTNKYESYLYYLFISNNIKLHLG